MPRGIGHRVSTSPDAPVLGRADLLPQTMLGDSFSIMRIGPEDAEAPLALLCGVVAFESPAVHEMLAVLPPIVRVDSSRHPVMTALLPLLAGELRDPRPGGDAVATRLADVLVVETVRAWLADQADRCERLARGAARSAARRGDRRGASRARPSVDAGVAGGPRHDVAVGVRGALHRRRRNVADGLRRRARGCGRRASMLADGSTVGAVAAALGYGSEAAFSRAFTRITGETPGRVRRAPSPRDSIASRNFHSRE